MGAQNEGALDLLLHNNKTDEFNGRVGLCYKFKNEHINVKRRKHIKMIDCGIGPARSHSGVTFNVSPCTDPN